MQRRESHRAVDPVVSIAYRSRGSRHGTNCVACDELHDTRNVLADTSEEYHGRNDNVGRFDPSGAHSSQGHKEDAGGKGEEAQGRRICKAAVVYRHPRLAAVIGALGLQTCRGVYVLLFRSRGKHDELRSLIQQAK